MHEAPQLLTIGQGKFVQLEAVGPIIYCLVSLLTLYFLDLQFYHA